MLYYQTWRLSFKNFNIKTVDYTHWRNNSLNYKTTAVTASIPIKTWPSRKLIYRGRKPLKCRTEADKIC